MKQVTIPKPDFVPGSAWELSDLVFDIEDKLSGDTRERISRRANVIAIKVMRLTEEGVGPYEDWDVQVLLMDQWKDCRPALLGVHRDGVELSDAEAGNLLGEINFISRDTICNEVVGANQLGLKKGSA